MTFTLSSPAFKNNCAIPEQFTGDGEDISPALEWTFVPPGTKSFALICDDPDAPAGTWVHWVLYDLPGDVRSLEKNTPKTEDVLDGARQGVNDFNKIGYGGPAPPSGSPHRYFFKLYALDAETGLAPRATKEEVMDAIVPHILGQARLMGTYRR